MDSASYCALTLSIERSASKVAPGLLRKSTLVGVAPLGQGEAASETQYLFQPMDESTTPSVEMSKLAQSAPCCFFKWEVVLGDAAQMALIVRSCC